MFLDRRLCYFFSLEVKLTVSKAEYDLFLARASFYIFPHANKSHLQGGAKPCYALSHSIDIVIVGTLILTQSAAVRCVCVFTDGFCLSLYGFFLVRILKVRKKFFCFKKVSFVIFLFFYFFFKDIYFLHKIYFNIQLKEIVKII